MLEDGTQFDSSRAKGKPLEMKLGTGEVIKGWDLAVETMRVGEKAVVEIPPQYAYGDIGAGKVIPPGATLFFHMELVSIKPLGSEIKKQMLMAFIFFGMLLSYFHWQGHFLLHG